MLSGLIWASCRELGSSPITQSHEETHPPPPLKKHAKSQSLSLSGCLDFSSVWQSLILVPDTLALKSHSFLKFYDLCLPEFLRSVLFWKADITFAVSSQTPVKYQWSQPVFFQAVLVCSSANYSYRGVSQKQKTWYFSSVPLQND